MLRHQIRVRYAETDQMGVAHHASYVPWLEEARIDGMRQLGLSYKALEERGIGMPVVDIHVQYKRKLGFDDVVDLETTIEISGQSRVLFHTTLKKESQICAMATVTVATVNNQGVPTRIPEDVADFLAKAAQ